MSADPPTRRRNRNWLWVFAAMAVLGLLAVAINWSYNVGMPLTPERLKEAREQWARSRPTDYDLEVQFTTIPASSDGSARTVSDHFDINVRGGKIVGFLFNGKEPEPLFNRDGTRNLDAERRQRENYDIDGLFSVMEEFLEKDRHDGVKSFLVARFAKEDGHVTLFKRQVSTPNGRSAQHIQVRLKKV